MADPQAAEVLIVGATETLGGRVVREGSDATRLTEQGVEVVRGNLIDRPR